jgi:hypothetical protein
MPAAIADRVIQRCADRSARRLQVRTTSINGRAASASSVLAAQCNGVSGAPPDEQALGSAPAAIKIRDNLRATGKIPRPVRDDMQRRLCPAAGPASCSAARPGYPASNLLSAPISPVWMATTSPAAGWSAMFMVTFLINQASCSTARDLTGICQAGKTMKLDILHVPGCPGAAVLHTLLTPILAERSDLQVTWHIVHNEDQARQQGMTGSPTLLVNGTDPFARPGQQPTLSCRLYPGEDNRPGPAPSITQLSAILHPGQVAVTFRTAIGALGASVTACPARVARHRGP